MRAFRFAGFIVFWLLVFISSALRADPAADAHPRVSIVADHLTLTFDQPPGPDLYIVELSDELAQWRSGEAFTEVVSTVPGPGGTQTVKVRSRSLVSVKPKEFLRLRVIVDPHGPVVYLSGLHYAWNTAGAQLAARVLGVEAAHLTSLALNGSALTVQAGDFLLNVTLSEGVNTFTLAATDDHGVPGQATANVLLDTIPPVIAITSPDVGATFTISRLNVGGTVSDANVITSVTVNGVPAYVADGQFTAFNVPLIPGANTFVAVATDVAGNTGTSQRAVNADASGNGGVLIDPVSLAAAPVSGFAPLTVTFTPQAPMPGTLQSVSYDFNGDLIPDLNMTSLAPVTHTYAVAGEYFPIVTVTTSAASASSPGGYFADPTTRLTIRVENPPVVQSTLSIPTPVDLHAASDGTLYVLSQSTATVTQYDATGTALRTVTGLGANPSGLTVDAFGNVFVAETGSHQVVMLAPNGNTFTPVMTLGKSDATAGNGDGEFSLPYDVAVSSAGEIHVTDTGNHRVVKFGADGSFIQYVGAEGFNGGQWNSPKGITYGSYGNLWVTDAGANKIVNISSELVSEVVGQPGTDLGKFQLPRNAISIDDEIYVADAGNNRVQKFLDGSTGGEGSHVPTHADWQLGSGLGLNAPSSVAARRTNTATLLYIADTGNNRVVTLSIPNGETPAAAWSAFQLLMQSHQLEPALTYLASDTIDSHREVFNQLGIVASAEIVSGMAPIFEVSNSEGLAKYRFVSGDTGITFFISFIRENGQWKILEF